VFGKNGEKWIPEMTKNSNALVKMSLSMVLPSVMNGILDKQGSVSIVWNIHHISQF